MIFYIIVHKDYLDSFIQATLHKKAKIAKEFFVKDNQYMKDWDRAKKDGWLCKKVNVEYLEGR